MRKPPREIDGAKVLKYAVVSPDAEATGATHHTVGGVELGQAAALAITRYTSEEGFYLFYLDQHGSVVTDTWHESADAALAQAAFEYEGLTWADVPPPT